MREREREREEMHVLYVQWVRVRYGDFKPGKCERDLTRKNRNKLTYLERGLW